MFATKAGIARRIERRDRQRKSQHFDEPAYLAGPPNVGRSLCAARFASLERCIILLCGAKTRQRQPVPVASDVNFIGVRPAVLATESEAGRDCAFAWICARGKNNRLQSLLRAERQK